MVLPEALVFTERAHGENERLRQSHHGRGRVQRHKGFHMVTNIHWRRGVTLVEVMMTVTILALVAGVGPKILAAVVHYGRVQTARLNIQKNARTSLDTV